MRHECIFVRTRGSERHAPGRPTRVGVQSSRRASLLRRDRGRWRVGGRQLCGGVGIRLPLVRRRGRVSHDYRGRNLNHLQRAPRAQNQAAVSPTPYARSTRLYDVYIRSGQRMRCAGLHGRDNTERHDDQRQPKHRRDVLHIHQSGGLRQSALRLRGRGGPQRKGLRHLHRLAVHRHAREGTRAPGGQRRGCLRKVWPVRVCSGPRGGAHARHRLLVRLQQRRQLKGVQQPLLCERQGGYRRATVQDVYARARIRARVARILWRVLDVQ